MIASISFSNTSLSSLENKSLAVLWLSTFVRSVGRSFVRSFIQFLTAIMFGWASLVPVLRDEADMADDSAAAGTTIKGYNPSQLSQIFTAGAVGNYLAYLLLGLILDA